MRSLVFERPGRLGWHDLPTPQVQEPTDALVRPIAVARCDLDAAIVAGAAPFRSRALHWLRDRLPRAVGRDGIFRKAPFAGPFPFGHECVAEVIEVGARVETIAAGARVVVPFQIACGVCERCRRGITASCTAVPAGASYGLGRGTWGGVVSDVVRVPFADRMLVAAPPGVDAIELASAGDNVADGVRTVVGPLEARPGAAVLVVGGAAASVGLYAVAAARALGACDVVYLDQLPERLAIAERLGARVIDDSYHPLRTMYPITVDASADLHGLDAAVRSTEPGGVCTSVGIYFATASPFPLLAAFMAGIEFRTGRVCSRAMLPRVLELIAARRIVPSAVTPRVFAWTDAPAAFGASATKVIVTR
jgi:threonine dehydrogenase-like Zn-dependent dehydrogenase